MSPDTVISHGLTSFSEAIPNIVEDPPAPVLLSPLMNPYEDTTPAALMSRNYMVSQVVWDASMPYGTLLAHDMFPSLLFDAPRMIDNLSTYRYFKADVNFEVRLSATAMHFGALGVSWLPYMSPGPTHQDINTVSVVQRLMHNASIMVVPAQQSVTGTIKFIADRQAIDLSQIDDEESMIGTLWIDVVSQLNQGAAGIPPVTVSVYANFTNVELYGHVPLAYIDTSGVASPEIEALIKTASNTFYKPGSEAKQSASPSSVIGDIVSVAASLAPLVKLALDKPSNTAITQPVYPRMFADYNYANGLDNGIKLSVDPSSSLANMHSDYGVSSMYDFIKTPILRHRRELSSTSPVDSVLTAFACSPRHMVSGTLNGNHVESHLAFAAHYFSYWRGSFKVKIYFICSKFTTARIRISHIVTDSTPTGAIEAWGGDIPSKVVDVQGPTECTFSVPYVSANVYQEIIDSTPDSWVAFSLVNPVTGNDSAVEAKIDMLMFVSPGEDMSLMWNNGYSDTSPTKYSYYDTSLEQEFALPFEGLIPATYSSEVRIVASDEQLSFYEYLHRYTQVGNRAYESPIPFYTGPLGHFPCTPAERPMLDTFCYCFMFWRGSVRYKFENASTVTLQPRFNTSRYAVRAYPSTTQGTHPPGSVSSVTEVTVPYYYPNALCRLYSARRGYSHDTHITAAQFGTQHVAAGEDFQLFVKLAPPMRIVAAEESVSAPTNRKILEPSPRSSTRKFE